MRMSITKCVLYWPCEESSQKPGQETDEQGSSLGADVARLQGLTDGVVALETDRQDSQHWSVRHSQFHEWNYLTWNKTRLFLYKL